MGFHKTSATRNMRTTQAHLERKDDGSIYAVYKLNFRKDAPRFEYCFIGKQEGTLTYNGNAIDCHPKFKGVGDFEGWCNRYVAEHEL